MNDAILEFNPKLPKLSKSEKAVLKLLVEAGKLIAPIYLEQEKQPVFPRAEIEKAAKKNPQILSPYTALEKVNGKLVAIPYHKKYATLLKPVAQKLEEAAEITENKEFGQALKIQARALLEGTYEVAIATWLKLKPYILDISIGPINYIDDKFFFGKASYQAWVGVLDLEGTKRLNNYKNIIVSANRKALLPKERIENLRPVKAKTIDEVLLAGVLAKTKFVGLNIPMDSRLAVKYGLEVTIFNQANDLRLEEQIMPTFNKIFSSGFKEGFSREDLRRGSLCYVALHELAHNYLHYKKSQDNLKDLFSPIFELEATVLGFRMAGALLLKDIITNKMLESMIVAFICRSFDLMEKSREWTPLVNYTLGGIVFINYMIENGAIKQMKKMAIPNFMKIFVSLHELSRILERILASGTRKDAEEFIKKYAIRITL